MAKIKKKSKLAAKLGKKQEPTEKNNTPPPRLSGEQITQEILRAEKFRKEGNLQAAASILTGILQYEPDHVKTIFFLGTIISKMEDYQRAAALFSKAINLDPNFAEAYFYLGMVLDKVGQYSDACKAFQKASELKEGYVDAQYNLACVLKKTHHPIPAADIYEQILDKNPNHIMSLMELAPLYFSQGHMEKTSEIYDRIYNLTKNPAAALSRDLLMPIVLPGNKDEIIAIRERYEDVLDKYIKEAPFIDKPHALIKRTSFRLAYQGFNDKDLMVKLAQMYEAVHPPLLFTADHCKSIIKKAPGEKIRVGFVSKYFHTHSVSRSLGGIMTGLAKEGSFEMFMISTEQAKLHDSVFNSLSEKCHGTLQIDGELSEMQKKIAALKLDIIIYPEIGMDQLAYCLAYARLAPVQTLFAGHPVTSGIRNIDYYISSKNLELMPQAKDHYSEELILLDHHPAIPERPQMPDKILSKEELNLPGDKNIYLCPMKMQKIHPDFDYAMNKILEKDPNGVIILFKDVGVLADLLMERFKTTINNNVLERIKIAPWAKRDELMCYLHHSDVVLDPFHFGGGTTCYMILEADAPMVTWPTEFMRARTGYAMYKIIGEMDLVAETPDKYVDMAVKLATDKEYHKAIRQSIRERKDVFFDNDGIINEFAEVLKDLCRKRGVIG